MSSLGLLGRTTGKVVQCVCVSSSMNIDVQLLQLWKRKRTSLHMFFIMNSLYMICDACDISSQKNLQVMLFSVICSTFLPVMNIVLQVLHHFIVSQMLDLSYFNSPPLQVQYAWNKRTNRSQTWGSLTTVLLRWEMKVKRTLILSLFLPTVIWVNNSPLHPFITRLAQSFQLLHCHDTFKYLIASDYVRTLLCLVQASLWTQGRV